MIFVSLKRTAQLDFTTPLSHCCNCGAARAIALVDTPLRRTRYMLFGGTELTIHETFPYCRDCRDSAGRVRPGTLARVLCGAMAAVAVFTALCIRLSIVDTAFTPFIRDHLFATAIVVASASCFAYFRWRDSHAGGRSYYQPARLADVTLDGDHVRRVTLAFFDAGYGEAFAAANADRVRAGWLEVMAA
ncbi:MAG: hypothetical protein ABJD97_12930 [Betaproteobacteria bacterium]